MVFDDLIDRLIVQEQGKAILLSILISGLTAVFLTNSEIGISRFNFLYQFYRFLGLPVHDGAFLSTVVFGIRGLDLVLEILIAAVLAFFIVLIVFTLFSWMADVGNKVKQRLM